MIGIGIAGNRAQLGQVRPGADSDGEDLRALRAGGFRLRDRVARLVVLAVGEDDEDLRDAGAACDDQLALRQSDALLNVSAPDDLGHG